MANEHKLVTHPLYGYLHFDPLSSMEFDGKLSAIPLCSTCMQNDFNGVAQCIIMTIL